MIDRTNEGKTATHKNGSQAIVIDEYKRTTDGRAMITVRRLTDARVAHWHANKVTMEA